MERLTVHDEYDHGRLTWKKMADGLAMESIRDST